MSDGITYVYSNVVMGADVRLGRWVIIGEPPRGIAEGEIVTIIGCQAVIRSHSVIYAGNTIGDRFQTGHGVMVRELNEIGDDVSIGTHSIIEHHVKLGSRVRIHSNVFIPEYSIIEADAWIGPNVVFTNALYPMSREAKKMLEGPHMLPGAKIGANATVLPGVTIGRNALVGVHDVPNGKVVAGNPARIIKDVADIKAYEVLSQFEQRGEV
jgi:acetyltransferase-like isoleucine patch superfamily enzyme